LYILFLLLCSNLEIIYCSNVIDDVNYNYNNNNSRILN